MMGRQATAVVARETGPCSLLGRASEATRRDFVKLEAGVAARVAPLAADYAAAGVPLQCGQRVLMVLPLNTRQFVRAMARHLCFN